VGVVVVVVVVMMIAVAPIPVRVLVVMVVMVGMAKTEVELRELQGLARAPRLLILGTKHVHRVRDGVEQRPEGLRGFQAGRLARGRRDSGAPAAAEGERRSAAKKSDDCFVHGVLLSCSNR